MSHFSLAHFVTIEKARRYEKFQVYNLGVLDMQIVV